MAAIHTPTPLSSAAGLISAILIGQIAIDVGLFVPEVILYVAVSVMGHMQHRVMNWDSEIRLENCLLLF